MAICRNVKCQAEERIVRCMYNILILSEKSIIKILFIICIFASYFQLFFYTSYFNINIEIKLVNKFRFAMLYSSKKQIIF